MREIKFRIFNKNRKVFYYFELDALLRSAFGNLTLIDGGAMDGVTKPWMQYTGLKDKNGKEIYEGDIVKGSDWIIEGVTIPECHRDNTRSISDGEVIGNIYENPELLKQDDGIILNSMKHPHHEECTCSLCKEDGYP